MLLRQIWIEIGFNDKLLNPYKIVRMKIKKIWEEAATAVSKNGPAAKKSRLKQKMVDSSESIVDILLCRYKKYFI